MTSSPDEVETRIERYTQRYGLTLGQKLGFGWDGIVFRTSLPSAIKGFRHDRLYLRERDVYLRLRDLGIYQVEQFNIPELIRSDDDLLVIEMSIVSPPFVLDFAGASLDIPPDYPEEVWEEWLAEKQEQFRDRWPRVESIMAVFRGMGIYLSDVKPGNIEFDPEEES